MSNEIDDLLRGLLASLPDPAFIKVPGTDLDPQRGAYCSECGLCLFTITFARQIGYADRGHVIYDYAELLRGQISVCPGCRVEFGPAPLV